MGCYIHLAEDGCGVHGGEAGKVRQWPVGRVMGRVRRDSESCARSPPGRDMRGYWWSCFGLHRMKGALGQEHITPGLAPKWGRSVERESGVWAVFWAKGKKAHQMPLLLPSLVFPPLILLCWWQEGWLFCSASQLKAGKCYHFNSPELLIL